MQHNVSAAIFNLAQYSVCGSHLRGRRSMRRVACFLRLPFLPCTKPHRTIICACCCRTQQYALRTATRCAFGASSAFRWNVSVEKKFGVLFWCTQRYQRCTQRCQLHLRRHCHCLLRLWRQQMAALNFVHFFMRWFVKIDREVTSNKKFKKYNIVNKKILIAFVHF